MICLVTQHFNFNRLFLLGLGLWPYKRSKLVRLQIILHYAILVSCIVFQITSFITAEYTPDLCVQVFSCSTLVAIFLIKYNAFCVNAQSIKYLLEQLQRIYDELKDENEIAIIEKYGCYSKRFTTNIMLFAICGVFTVIIQQIKVFRSHNKMFAVTEYFIDHEKYPYLILLHINVTLCIGIFTMVATGSMLFATIEHACGLFSIASYRLEQTMAIDGFENKTTIYEKTIHAVNMHRKAMEYSEFFISTFEGSFFVLVAFLVLGLSLNLFRIFQLATLEDDIHELLARMLCAAVLIFYMFIANYAGQKIMDHNEHIYVTAYNIRWYAASLHTQKMILFILQRGSKTFALHIGGLFTGSVECFATLASTSVSYFTVMYSVQ